MTPRTLSPTETAYDASVAARSGVIPHLGIPTFTSISTSVIPHSAANDAVISESIATVIRTNSEDFVFNNAAIARSRETSTVSLASNKSVPSPAWAIPMTSRGVAHVNAVCPTAAS